MEASDVRGGSSSGPPVEDMEHCWCPLYVTECDNWVGIWVEAPQHSEPSGVTKTLWNFVVCL